MNTKKHISYILIILLLSLQVAPSLHILDHNKAVVDNSCCGSHNDNQQSNQNSDNPEDNDCSVCMLLACNSSFMFLNQIFWHIEKCSYHYITSAKSYSADIHSSSSRSPPISHT